MTINSSDIDGFYCQCLDHYYGDYCENLIDYCSLYNVTCSNRGKCSSSGGNMTICSCFKTFSGESCEIESHEGKVRRAVSTTASIIAIISIVTVYVYVFSMDMMKYACRRKKKQKRNEKKSKNSKRNP